MSLFKRKNSKYYWMKFTFDGQLIQRSTNVANKKDATTIENAFRTQLALGKIGIEPLKKAPTFDKAVEDFLAWIALEHANKPKTYQTYYYNCETLKSYFGKVKTNLITTKEIEKYVIWRSELVSKKTNKPVSRETINYELLMLKMIFKRLCNAKMLRENPAVLFKSLPKNEKKFHVVTPDEEKVFLLACPQPLKDVAALMIQTGMRCGEVYRIKRSEVFLDKSFLKVTEGKTQSSVRNIHLSEKAKRVLEYRLNKFKGEQLFPQNDVDGAQASKTIDQMHRRTIAKIGLQFRLYDCRHTFATRAIENGVDLLTLASILGHTNLNMVTRYSHPSEERKANAIKLMHEPKREAKAV